MEIDNYWGKDTTKNLQNKIFGLKTCFTDDFMRVSALKVPQRGIFHAQSIAYRYQWPILSGKLCHRSKEN